MKVLVEYTLGYKDPTWIMVESDLFDLKGDTIKSLMTRLEEEHNRINNGWCPFPHSRQLAIRNNLKVIQALPEKINEQVGIYRKPGSGTCYSPRTVQFRKEGQGQPVL